MKALILAAGKGTRLGALTETIPKPMVPVGDRPLLDHIVDWLRLHGIRQIAMNLHHAPQVIIDHFGDGRRAGVEITYSFEQQLLGTAGAAKRLESFLNQSFVLVYGDVYTNLDLGRLMRFHQQARVGLGQAPVMTLALYRVPNPSQCGLVDVDQHGRVLRFVEKPPPELVFTDLANAGISIVEPSVLELIPAETIYDFGHNVIPQLLSNGAVIAGQPIDGDEFLIDIGTPQGLACAQRAWAPPPADSSDGANFAAAPTSKKTTL